MKVAIKREQSDACIGFVECEQTRHKVKWTVLSDNRSYDSSLFTEHGLSILLQTERYKILLDTGASDVFIRNAELLGVDLSDVDYVFISHGHSDHAGGLRYFLEHNRQAKVIVSPDAMSGQFFSKRGNLHSITTEWPEIDNERFIMIEHTCEVADGIHVIAHISQIHPMPKGNKNLYVLDTDRNYIHDDFRHELALHVDGFLFTGCTHSGLENILTASPWPVHTVVGGFHLLDGQETNEEIKELAQRLKANYPNTQFYTSHCTGDNVFEVMKGLMGEQLQSFRCGTMNENGMSRIVREARPTDLADIMQVIDAAKGIMRQSGNMHQWGEGYPSENVITADMEKNGGFVIEDDSKIVGYFAFLPSPEPTYSKIYDGEWLDDIQPYHVVHRIASYPDIHGIFSSIMDFCFSHDMNIRIDTHRDNKIMQHNILKHGFTYCGIIYLLSGDERLAYQKLVSR